MKKIFFIICLCVLTLKAEQMSVATHSALISKLEAVLNFSEESISKQNMKLRLADLYSERARMYAMEESGQGDIKYKKEISSDRLRAIELYSQAFKSETEIKRKGLLLFQMGHLQQLTGNKEKAMELYQDILKQKKNQNPLLLADAHIELGDLYFNQGNFKKATMHFENALKTPNISRTTYSKYRLSWCQFHDGKTERAIGSLKKLLKNKNAFLKLNGEPDLSFREEAARDLATFLARREVKESEIKDLMSLSPENTKQANLTYLATELDRTGKKISALKVWAILGDQNKDSESKLEGQIKVAKIQYDLGKKQETVKELKTAIQMLKETNCKEDCVSYQHQIRKIITDWGVAEEKEPSPELVAAYNAYDFEDAEMALWGAGSAHKRKQWADAYRLYSKSAKLTYRKINDFNKKSLDKNTYKILEASLLGAVDVAERSGDFKLKLGAYQQYLEMNPKGEKALEVEYQIAQTTLEQKKYEEASELFKKIVYSEKTDSQGLKEKAADLSLDSLALLKKDKIIEEWSLEYAKVFPKRKNEFLQISRKAVLNQAAQTINSTGSKSALNEEYERLSKVDLSGASDEESKKFLQHKTLIAAKTKNLDALILTNASLLKTKNLSEQEKQEALKQMSWAYEMKFEFKKAYETLKKVSVSSKEEKDHQLKLGALAELGGLKKPEHYETFLKLSKDKPKNALVALSLVRLEKNKEASFFKHKKHLKNNLSALSTAGLYAYEQNKNSEVKKQLLGEKGISKTFEGQLLLRADLLQKLNTMTAEIESHRINSKSNWSLAESMKKRISLLKKLESKAQAIIQTKDFSAQILVLFKVAKENKRFANEIAKLPIPKNLNKKEKEEYSKLIAQQVRPYINKEEEIQSKMNQLWRNRDETAFEDVFLTSTQPQAAGYKLAQEEVSKVLTVANFLGLSTSDYSADKIRQKRQKLSQELVDLKNKAQENPYDSSNLKQMKKIEATLNPGPMVAYLELRLSQSE